MKRYLCYFYSALLTAALFAGCTSPAEGPSVPAVQNQPAVQTETQQEEKLLSLTLPGSKRMFQQQPALLDGPGQQALPLVFQTLVELTPEYQWKGQLAAEVTGEGLEYTVTLRENALFSDGTALQASHVVQSFEAAIGEGSPYKQALAHVESCHAVNSTTVVFTLTQADRFFANLLTFPIAKQNEAGQYIGSGPYAFAGQEEAITLEQNPYYSGEKSSLTTITLLGLPEEEVLPYSLKIGEIDCLYNPLSTMESMNISNFNYPVNLTNLVFLGVQCGDGPMASVELRQVVDAAINREILAQRVYSSKAQPTSGPFPLSFYSGDKAGSTKANLALSAQYMEQAGYTKNQQGFFEKEGQPLTLTLLYNSDNGYRHQTAGLVAQQLHLAGISVELAGKPYEEYKEALEDGQYDLYVGEMDMGDNFNIAPLFTPGEGHGYGALWESSLTESYNAFQAGTVTTESFWEDYRQELPVIPLLYRQGLVAFNKDYGLNVVATKQNIFYNLPQWQ